MSDSTQHFTDRKQFNTYIQNLYLMGTLSSIQARNIIRNARKISNKEHEDKIKMYMTGYEHGVMDMYEHNLEDGELSKILTKYQGESDEKIL